MTAPGSPPGPAGFRVERAAAGDADVLALVIADAFADLDVSQWLVPGRAARRAIFPLYFGILVGHALARGLVLTTGERDAAALWLPVAASGPAEPPAGHRERLAAVTGPNLARFQALDQALGQHHPAGAAHEHLAILAVRPGRQRLGIGTALMNARHADLDRNATPAYLEASDLSTRTIYRRHGYADLATPIQLPDGPAMYPMWRQPRGEAGGAPDPSPPGSAVRTCHDRLTREGKAQAHQTQHQRRALPGHPGNRRKCSAPAPDCQQQPRT
jgi:GNAT superfamily N-acetyltransferase